MHLHRTTDAYATDKYRSPLPSLFVVVKSKVFHHAIVGVQDFGRRRRQLVSPVQALGPKSSIESNRSAFRRPTTRCLKGSMQGHGLASSAIMIRGCGCLERGRRCGGRGSRRIDPSAGKDIIQLFDLGSCFLTVPLSLPVRSSRVQTLGSNSRRCCRADQLVLGSL
jgi:hypothetical protein